MADKKISQLTAVTTPLAGTETLPIVQSGSTKKVTALELTGVNVTADSRVGVGGAPDITVNGSPCTAKFGVHQDGGSTNYPVVEAVKYSDTTATAGVTICAARGRGSIATPTVVSDGDLLSSHIAAGYDGADFAISSRINYEVDGTPSNDDMPGRIVFLTAADGSQTPTERMRVDSDGNTTIANGNLVIGTSGKGIDFSADGQAAGMTSELLDDYEEGTWTPVKGGFVEAGGGSYTLAGEYTKIGNVVNVSCSISMSGGATIASLGGASAYISGLPFTASSSVGKSSALLNGNPYGMDDLGISLVALNTDTFYPSAFSATPANQRVIFSGHYFV